MERGTMYCINVSPSHRGGAVSAPLFLRVVGRNGEATFPRNNPVTQYRGKCRFSTFKHNKQYTLIFRKIFSRFTWSKQKWLLL